MIQDTQKTIENAANIDAQHAGNIVVLAIIGAIIRAMVGEKCRNCKRVLSNVILGAFVGLIIYYIATYYTIGDSITNAITGICAVLARDILSAVLKLGKGLSDNPLGFLKDIKEVIKK